MSKAIHLGSDLSSDCDNATNFVGADTKLQELKAAFNKHQGSLLSHSVQERVTFRFIPPRASHFVSSSQGRRISAAMGAAVKSVKNLLLRTMGWTDNAADKGRVKQQAHSTDPNDDEVLTPAQLLIGEVMHSLPHASPPKYSTLKDVKPCPDPNNYFGGHGRRIMS